MNEVIEIGRTHDKLTHDESGNWYVKESCIPLNRFCRKVDGNWLMCHPEPPHSIYSITANYPIPDELVTPV